ncbi:hypothetical protein, partial [Vibrio cholerae]|uniref:hypothetical protein n=1 Tax=Vibrio cholerae TaxID=666 RepID=UPI001C8D48AF
DMHNKLLIQDLESKFKETEQQKVSLIKARQIKNEEHERLQDKISKLEFSKSQYESTLLNYKSNLENFQNSAHQRIFKFKILVWILISGLLVSNYQYFLILIHFVQRMTST